jgi:hypothetical protein
MRPRGNSNELERKIAKMYNETEYAGREEEEPEPKHKMTEKEARMEKGNL